jgi:glycosyltransferase involved in cell wall biosynthesis
VISIVVPIWDEVGSLPHLAEEVMARDIGDKIELILVEDGSTDGSAEAMDEMAQEDERIVPVHLGAHRGKSAAYTAGFKHARGDIIVTLDGDLQDDPADVPLLLDKLDDDHDAVIGWRRTRCHPYLSKVVPSRLFNLLVRIVFRLGLHDTNCPIRAIRARFVRELELAPGEHRYLPVLLALRGARLGEVTVSHRPRKYGDAKFGSPFRLAEGIACLLRLGLWGERRG